VTHRAITLIQVEKKRESAGANFLLQIPEFYVTPGEFVVIVGSSGCGKSTLMDMLALVLRPSAAQIFQFTDAYGDIHDAHALWRDGKENKLSAIRRDVLAYVLQSGGLFPYLSVQENAVVPRRLKGLPENKQLLQEIAYAIGLAVPIAGNHGAQASGGASFSADHLSGADYSLLRKKPRHLSGGQRQRSAILRALMSEPAIILADEPTAAVDEITAQSIMEEFKYVARQLNVSVVMVTHDRHLVRGRVDRAYTFDVTRDGNSGLICSRLIDLPTHEL